MTAGATRHDAPSREVPLDPEATTEKSTSAYPREALVRGAQIQRYVILRRLGNGGMGVVYLAYDPELDRRVAIKLLRPDRDILEMNEARHPGYRLLREAQAMARLSHPNVVAVYDVGTVDDDVFITMEYIQGSTLGHWQGTKRPTIQELVATFLQAGRALAAAHDAGLMHRDFKPDNVLVEDKSKRAVVLDFGLARTLPGTLDRQSMSRLALGDTSVLAGSALVSPLTVQGRIMGTPAYMAPEQLVGAELDGRADQFSFCVALHEAIFGCRPFEGETLAQLLGAIARQRSVSIGSSSVSSRLRRILARGLRFDREDRYPTIRALLEELERTLDEPRRRRAAAMRVGFGVAALAGCIALLARPAKQGVCKGLERGLDQAWDAARRAQVSQAFEQAAGKGSEAEATTLAAYDRYASSWLRAATASCEATRVHGTQSEEALDLRSACLAQCVRELGATSALLASGEPNALRSGAKLADGLTDIAKCEDAARLRAPFGLPRDPAKKEAVEKARTLLADSDAHFKVASYDRARDLAIAAEREAAAAGFEPARAEAVFTIGRAEGVKDTRRGADLLLEAALAAEASRHDALAATAWTWLVQYEGYILGRPTDGQRDARLAAAAIQRLGGDLLATALLKQKQANVLHEAGDEAGSESLFREVLAVYRRALPPEDSRIARAQIDLGEALYDHGRYADALALEREALATFASSHGSDEATMGHFLECIATAECALGREEALATVDRISPNYAVVSGQAHEARSCALVLTGRVQDGLAAMETAIQLDSRTYHPAHDGLLSKRAHRALFRLRQRQVDLATSEIEEVAAIAARASLKGPAAAFVFAVQALTHARRRMPSEALASAKRALDEVTAFGGEQSHSALLAHLAAGEAKRLQRESVSAVRALDHALSLSSAGLDPVLLADVQFALARALFEAKQDAARGRALALLATDGYVRAGRRDWAAGVRSWLRGRGR